jgi:hypothetical protein
MTVDERGARGNEHLQDEREWGERLRNETDMSHPEFIRGVCALQIPPSRPGNSVGWLQLTAHRALLEVVEGPGCFGGVHGGDGRPSVQSSGGRVSEKGDGQDLTARAGEGINISATRALQCVCGRLEKSEPGVCTCLPWPDVASNGILPSSAL